MAMKNPNNKTNNKKEVYTYPSRFGSHWNMINVDLTKELEDKTLVYCTDEYGNYITKKQNLDSGLADPNRYTSARLEHLCSHRTTID